MKKLIIIICILGFLTGLINTKKIKYDYKISVEFNNFNSEEIDNTFAKKIDEKLLAQKNIKDYIIISKNNYCSIYIKTPFFKKENSLFSVKLKIDEITQAYNYPILKIDYENLNYRYEKFIVLSSSDNNYKNLLYDVLEFDKNIKKENFINNTTIIGDKELFTYVYFSDSTLEKYKISIEDIIKKIKTYNLKNTGLDINLNTNIKNEEDVKKIALSFKDNDFNELFENIFNITTKENPNNPNIELNNNKALILAIKKRNNYPSFLFNCQIKNFIQNYEKKNNLLISYINPRTLSKSIIYFKEYKIKKTREEKKKIFETLKKNKINNILYLIGYSDEKIMTSKVEYENFENRLILIYKKRNKRKIEKILNSKKYNARTNKKIIKNYSINTLKEQYRNLKNVGVNVYFTPNYTIEKYAMLDYQITKKDILNTIVANTSELYIDNYFNNNFLIKIVIKNKKPSNFIYSKKLDNLIDLNAILNSQISTKYRILMRKKRKYCIFLIK